jgi:hypothetical protein
MGSIKLYKLSGILLQFYFGVSIVLWHQQLLWVMKKIFFFFKVNVLILFFTESIQLCVEYY